MNKKLQIALVVLGFIAIFFIVFFSSKQSGYDYIGDTPIQFSVDVTWSEGGYVYQEGNAVEGTYYLMVAIPYEGYEFAGWSSPHEGEEQGLNFQMSRNHTYHANFIKV